MKALLIFDNLNDLIYSKWDEFFIQRLKKLMDQEVDNEYDDKSTVSQLLSPMITSQRVMSAQFGNTYSSMQCEDGTNIAFDEWMDHLFMIISQDDIDDLHRELMDCKTFVQHICGNNFNLLTTAAHQDWLTALLDSRTKGDVVPGAGGLIGESGATAAALSALKLAAATITADKYQKYHLMLFVGDKLLALYSSRGCEDLTPADILLLSIQCVAAQLHWESVGMLSMPAEATDENPHADAHHTHRTTRIPWLSAANSGLVNVCAGPTCQPCAAHCLHLACVAPWITLAILTDMELREIGITAHTSNQILANLRRLLLQRNIDSLPPTLEALENSVKKTLEALRRDKSNASLCSRLSARMLELKKSATTTTPLTPETTATAMHTALEAVIERLRPDLPVLHYTDGLDTLRDKLAPYFDFLRVKAMRYFSLESYVEEFPGLVHFVYIDRTAGRFLAPDLAESNMINRDTLVSMLSRSMRLIREGYSAATWRSGALHACLVLWWECKGVAVRPRALRPAAVRALPPPGDLLATFYRQLAEMAFPNESSAVTIKELLCVHLGLLPSSTAVQQARRLAHTVHDAAGDNRLNPADLL